MINKKGAEKIISVYWFVILIIVAGGIYAMVSTFYGHPYDVRDLEATILMNNVADCISKQGHLEEFVFDEEETNFLEKCNITFATEDFSNWKERGQYYLEINFYDVGEINLKTILEGEKSLKKDCDLNKNKSFELLPTCVNGRFYSLDNNKQIFIDILSVVRKTEKNVKI